MAAMVRCTLDPAGITTCPLLSFTSEDTVPVSFWPALCVRELIPSSNLAEIAVPLARVAAPALAGAFVAGLAATLAVDFAGAFWGARSLNEALASTEGRCRSRSVLSAAIALAWSRPHPARRATASNASRLPAMVPLRNYWTGLKIGMQTGQVRAIPRPGKRGSGAAGQRGSGNRN